MKTVKHLIILIIGAMPWIVACAEVRDSTAVAATNAAMPDSAIVGDTTAMATDSISTAVAEADRYKKLTDADFRKVADELGVDVASLRAVVEIEAGKAQSGFTSPGVPVINFDRTMFLRFLRKAGISTSKYKGNEALGHINTRKYGSYARAQMARLEAGRKISSDIANSATFWGMFQIGGFNWKKCGCKSVDDFVAKMSYSEELQLELFGEFMKSTGLLKHLKNHNWKQFALGFNGPNALRRGYHTRLARCYAKYSKK